MESELGQKRKGRKKDFATTKWSLIIEGKSAEADARKAHEALSHLCRAYWRPIFSFICRRPFSVQDAQDLTQDFFAMILETNWLRHADQRRGRFRTVLLRSLVNFLNDDATRKETRKRGGEVELISWDDLVAEAPSQLSISARAYDTMSSDSLYDVRWAATVVEQALRRLGRECEEKGRLRLFDALSGFLTSDRADVSYGKVAASLGVSEDMVRRQLHNLRQRFRFLLRREVSRTVSDSSEIEDEIRHLCAALASASD